MNIRDFNNTNRNIINRGLVQLREEHGVKLNISSASQDNLRKLAESASTMVNKMRGTQAKFHRDPQYVKYMHVKDVCNAMIAEGVYSQGPKYEAMVEEMTGAVRELMDRGYTDDEASAECMNRARMNPAHAYDDSILHAIVAKAVNDYLAVTGVDNDYKDEPEMGIMEPGVEMELPVVNEIVKVAGLQEDNMDGVEQRVGEYAEACGKTRNSVVEFLNAVGDKRLPAAVAMLEGKLKAVGVTESTQTTKEDTMENMFKDIIAEMLNEEVNMDEAEVVMATQGMADDIQDVNEKVGRMVNEDIVAIADKIRNEQGADAAQQFIDSMSQALSAYMEAGKAAKAQLDQVISGLSGGGMAGAPGVMGSGMDPMAGDDLGAELDAIDPAGGMDDMEMDDNVDAAAGPVDEPLGRAEL